MRAAAAVLALGVALAASAPPAHAALGTQPVAAFDSPTSIAAPPGDPTRLFVTEQDGLVRIVVNGEKLAAPFLDVTGLTNANNEQGLLSVAFAPDYATSGLFYVFLTAADDGRLRVLEGQRSAQNPNVATGSLRQVFAIDHSEADNHNGGQLAFGPDGLLYASTGDGGIQGDPDGDAQDPNSLLGKILRIDVRGGATAPSVWALGLRNPWRFSFDRVTGDMLIGDVGGDLQEEIDRAPAGTPAGRNYGWPACEGAGPCSLSGAVAPLYAMTHADGFHGVIGGFVVRDPSLPTLLGRYVFADLAKPHPYVIDLAAPARAELTAIDADGPRSFGEDACGHVYLARSGDVVRLTDGAAGACVEPPPPPPPPPPPGGGGTPEPDRRAPVLTLAFQRHQRVAHPRRRVKLRLTADESCVATLRARGLRARTVALTAGTSRRVKLTQTPRGLRQLRRALRTHERGVRRTVRIEATDAAGNVTLKRPRIRLR